MIELPKALSEEKLMEYFNLFKETNDYNYRSLLIEHNLRLVKSVILEKFYGYSVEELFTYGSEGLIKAVDSFDINYGSKFSTYACKCIETSIRQYFQYGSRMCRNAYVVSLYDNVLSDEEKLCYIDIIPSKSDSVETYEDKFILINIVNKFLSKFSLRDRLVIEMNLGINGQSEHKQIEIAKILGISQQNVSRIINRILPKLREQLTLLGYNRENVSYKKHI